MPYSINELAVLDQEGILGVCELVLNARDQSEVIFLSTDLPEGISCCTSLRFSLLSTKHELYKPKTIELLPFVANQLKTFCSYSTKYLRQQGMYMYFVHTPILVQIEIVRRSYLL